MHASFILKKQIKYIYKILNYKGNSLINKIGIPSIQSISVLFHNNNWYHADFTYAVGYSNYNFIKFLFPL